MEWSSLLFSCFSVNKPRFYRGEYEGPTSEIPDNKQERYQALHNMFVASAIVVKYAHENYPNFIMGNMICFVTSYPSTCDPDDILANQQNMNMINWFSSDIQVRGEYPYYTKCFFEENNIVIKMEPEDEQILKEGTVDLYTLSR